MVRERIKMKQVRGERRRKKEKEGERRERRRKRKLHRESRPFFFSSFFLLFFIFSYRSIDKLWYLLTTWEAQWQPPYMEVIESNSM